MIASLVLIALSLSAKAQTETVKTPASILQDFMKQRFGLFIHWGPVTLRGTEIGWSRGNEVSMEEYDSLYKEFNPVLFNADAWAKTAKDAGMKYLVITAKHHDGFCLWPTKQSDYNIMNSPYKKDVVGELAKACKKYGIKFCIYFTVLDWRDPNYSNSKDIRGKIDGTKPHADMVKFVTRMKAELKEVITAYHPYMLWFDGNWEIPWTNKMGEEVYAYIKQLDRNVIINNRLGQKNDHKIMSVETVGDYATPEQVIGRINMKDPWESCITICNQWAWKPNDKMKSLKQCIQTLASSAGGNGNLLFNVGPMMDGRIEKRQATRLKEMGDWLSLYGESIYATKGGPYAPDSSMAATRKGNKIYIHLFRKSGQQLTLAALSVTVNKVYFLKGKELSFTQNEKQITIDLPEQLPNDNDAVIVLETKGNTENIPILTK